MYGFLATEVPVKPHFQNKGLSLTALSVAPFWNHLVFRLSSQPNLFCQRRRALIPWPCAIYRGCWYVKTKKKKKIRSREKKPADLFVRTTVSSQATMCVSVVSQQRLG